MPFETRTRRWEAVNGCLLVTGFFNRGACNGPEKRRARFQWSVARLVAGSMSAMSLGYEYRARA